MRYEKARDRRAILMVQNLKISVSSRFCFYKGGIANTAEMKNEYRILVGKFDGDLGGIGST